MLMSCFAAAVGGAALQCPAQPRPPLAGRPRPPTPCPPKGTTAIRSAAATPRRSGGALGCASNGTRRSRCGAGGCSAPGAGARSTEQQCPRKSFAGLPFSVPLPVPLRTVGVPTLLLQRPATVCAGGRSGRRHRHSVPTAGVLRLHSSLLCSVLCHPEHGQDGLVRGCGWQTVSSCPISCSWMRHT